jgi:hypothetical protein
MALVRQQGWPPCLLYDQAWLVVMGVNVLSRMQMQLLSPLQLLQLQCWRAVHWK